MGMQKRMLNRAVSDDRMDDGTVSDTSTVFRFNQANQQAKEARDAAKAGVPQENDKFNTTNPNIMCSEGFSIANISNMNALPEVAFNYQVFSSKLVKFRDTKLRAVKFT